MDQLLQRFQSDHYADTDDHTHQSPGEITTEAGQPTIEIIQLQHNLAAGQQAEKDPVVLMGKAQTGRISRQLAKTKSINVAERRSEQLLLF